MRLQRASTNRSEIFRRSVFNFEKAISIGFRSGTLDVHNSTELGTKIWLNQKQDEARRGLPCAG